MGKPTGFLEYNREGSKWVEPEVRLQNFDEFVIPLDEDAQRNQAARCMNCGIPFCHSGIIFDRAVSGCPNNNLIPEWNELLYVGNFKGAWERLAATNVLPEMTARVCPAPCEGACTNALNGDAVTIKYNEFTITEKAFEAGWVEEGGKPGPRTDKKVAVVGSGPAGLSAAWRLNQLGHTVTVYERADRLGGLLMYGIPNMKLDKKIIDRRIAVMEKLGIEFITKCDVGKDISADEMNEKYDSVILCGGATTPRDLSIPGRELSGIRFAVDFLKKSTQTLLEKGNGALKDSLKGKNVIVIGGGDTGNDCVGTSIRCGAKHVEQFEIMPEPPSERTESNPWPRWPAVKKIDYGQQEAIYTQGKDPRTYEINTLKFNGKDGHVTSLDTVLINWEFPEGGGRPSPVPIKGTEKNYPADLVLLSMGFTGPENYLMDAFKVKPGEDYSTEYYNIFAAGDYRRGQSLVIWGILEGRKAAEDADKYLTKE